MTTLIDLKAFPRKLAELLGLAKPTSNTDDKPKPETKR